MRNSTAVAAGRGSRRGHQRVLVTPFCHSPIRLMASHRRLFERALPRTDFETLLRTTSIQVRQNVARIFVAGLLAEKLDATIAFVEGWRCHQIERTGSARRDMRTGSRMSHLLLRMLQRRGMLNTTLQTIRREASRCTLEEVQALAALGSDPGAGEIVGIAGLCCPSATRAEQYLRATTRIPSRVLTPSKALIRWNLPLNTAQAGLMRATTLSRREVLRAVIVEGANWGIHAVSGIEQALLGSRVPLEVRLARALRQDRPGR